MGRREETPLLRQCNVRRRATRRLDVGWFKAMERIRRPRGSGHIHYRSPQNSVRILLVFLAVVVLAVVCAILFAPRKPPPPPASAISYDDRPGQLARDEGAGYDPGPSSRGRRPRSHRPAAPAVEESKGRYKIFGTVTDAKTGKLIPDARVNCEPLDILDEIGALKKQKWNQEIEQQFQALQEKLKQNSAQGRTGNDGDYVLRTDATGEVVVRVWAQGYLHPEDKRGTIEEGSEGLRVDFALSSGASISGRITESGTRKGARGVMVSADGPPPFRGDAESDEEGRYTVSGLGPGDFDVTLVMRGAAYIVTGMIPSKRVTIKTESQEVKNVDFTVEVAGEVWGYVTTREGSPVKGTDVVVCTSASVFSQVAEASIKQAQPLSDSADGEGYYEILGVPLNKEWRLYAMTKELAPQLTAPFILTPSQRSARVDIYVSPGSSVYGRVVDPERKPIDGAEVICIPAYSKLFSPLDSPHAIRNQRSRDDGSFKIPQLPVGEYQILAQKKGYKFAAMGEPIYPDGYSDIRNVEVVLLPVESGQFAVYGTVTDAAGTPLKGVSLSLGSLSGDDLGAGESETTTDDQGNYTFQGVQSGFILLRAEKPGYQGQNVTNVKLDEPTNIVLQAGAYVRGRVLVRETGSPPQQASVRAIRVAGPEGGQAGLSFLDAGSSSSSSTDASGNFQLDVDAGSYMIEARSPGLTSGRTQVTVEAGESRDDVIVYVRQSGGQIEGRVTVAAGKSPEGALVWIAGGDSEMGLLSELGFSSGQRGIQVGADGAFQFSNLAEGTYTLRAKLEGYAQGQAGPVQVSGSQKVSGVEIALRPGSALEGYVAFNGRTEAGAIVTVVGNGISEMTTTDANGFYRIERLAPGTYLASAVSFSGGLTSGLFAPLHARVEIVEGTTTTYNFGEPTNTALVGLCTSGPPGGTVGYAVLHLPGSPADVSSLNFTNPATWFDDNSAAANYVVGMSTVDRDGYFRMDNLVEGEYLLDIFYANFGELLSGKVNQVYSGVAKIVNGQVTELDIPISGGG